MPTILGILAGCASVAGLLVYLRVRKGSGTDTSRAAARASASPFQGVEISVGTGACAAVRKLHGRRFLARNPPQLPVPGCTQRECKCAFKKLPDRRDDARRWSDHGVEVTLYAGQERRQRRDRRRG